MIREKQTVANRLLEIDFLPINPSGRRIPERAPKTKPSTEEQQMYNYNRATRRLIEVVNANFDERDYICVPTFAPDNSPATKEELDKIIGRFIRRINDYKKRRGLERSLYVYVRECETYKTGKKKGQPNPHCHIIIHGRGISRDKIKELWHDGHINVDEYDPDTFGPEAFCKYIRKDPQGKKNYVCAKGLKQPIVKPHKDGRIGKKAVERMATLHIDDKEYWEKRYPGYRLIRCFARFNKYNSHWYVSVVMFKNKPKPKHKPTAAGKGGRK